MKKLMIALAAVAMAIGAQAATANWKASAANIYNGKGTTATADKYTGAAYFFDASVISQELLFAAICDGAEITGVTGYITTGSVASGAIAATSNTFAKFEQASGDHSFYFALLTDDAMYLSKTVTQAAGGTDAAVSLAFGNQNPTSGNKSSSLPAATYEGVGQWTQTVPEPTSGLLLLLGMAGLALKRKQA